MYRQPRFAVDDDRVLRDLIDAYSFGTLVADSGEGLAGAHVPFLLERGAGGASRLLCHVARANPLWRAFEPEGPCLAVFLGPHGYVSPSWYEAPERAVPTWNYASVHAHGRGRAVHDGARKRSMVDRLAQRHEAGRERPWSLSGLAPALVESMLGAIVGIEIDVVRLDGTHKLSQNRSDSDRRRVVAALAQGGTEGERALAAYTLRHAAPERVP